MMTIDLVEKLYKSGDLRPLIECGMISVNVLNWRKIYNTYQGLIDKGVPKHKAKIYTAETHNIGKRSVYRILNFLTYEPQEKSNRE